MAIGTPVSEGGSHASGHDRELLILFTADDPRNPAHLIPFSHSELKSTTACPSRGAHNGRVGLLREQNWQPE